MSASFFKQYQATPVWCCAENRAAKNIIRKCRHRLQSRLNPVSQKLLALSAQLRHMRDMISKRPLTATIASFAMGGILAAVVLSFAETTPGYIAPIKYNPEDYHPGKGYTGPVTTPEKKTVILNRGLSDSSKTKEVVIIPAGTEVGVEKNGKRYWVTYQGKRVDMLGYQLSGNKTREDYKENVRFLAAPAGEKAELLDDSGRDSVLIRYKDTVFSVRKDELKPYEFTADRTPEKVAANPAGYAALGSPVKDWLETSQIIPGLKEKQPNGLWEKAGRMEHMARGASRIAQPHIEKPEFATSVWEMIAAYDEDTLPPWLPDTSPNQARKDKETAWRKEYKTMVGIEDYVSLRPEFDKWGVKIKGGVKGNTNLSCGVLSIQDALEYLWSKRIGFAVKADPNLIRQAFDSENAKRGIKWGGTNAQGKPLSENTNTRLLDYIHADGRYSVLTAKSRAKIPATGLPKLVIREMALGQMENGRFGSTPIRALMIEELKKGRVILAAGAQAAPEHLPARERIQSVRGGNSAYPYPKSGAGLVSHAQLITGYYAQHDDEAFHMEVGLFWEFRGNWGTDYGDQGYAYVPNDDLMMTYSTELLGLSLE